MRALVAVGLVVGLLLACGPKFPTVKDGAECSGIQAGKGEDGLVKFCFKGAWATAMLQVPADGGPDQVIDTTTVLGLAVGDSWSFWADEYAGDPSDAGMAFVDQEAQRLSLVGTCSALGATCIDGCLVTCRELAWHRPYTACKLDAGQPVEEVWPSGFMVYERCSSVCTADSCKALIYGLTGKCYPCGQ